MHIFDRPPDDFKTQKTYSRKVESNKNTCLVNKVTEKTYFGESVALLSSFMLKPLLGFLACPLLNVLFLAEQELVEPAPIEK